MFFFPTKAPETLARLALIDFPDTDDRDFVCDLVELIGGIEEFVVAISVGEVSCERGDGGFVFFPTKELPELEFIINAPDFVDLVFLVAGSEGFPEDAITAPDGVDLVAVLPLAYYIY